MADSENKNKGGDEMVQVPQSLLTSIQEQLAASEKKDADHDAKIAGLEELISQDKGADASGSPKLRERKSFEPAFRTVRIRKYPIGGDVGNLGYVIGWTNRGAYQEVDRTGVRPEIVDYLDIFFLGHERGKDGKLKAEKVKLLDLYNNGIQVHCKVLDVKKEVKKDPTGEEIDISIFDPAHGLTSTGETIDGWVAHTEQTLTIQIPGVAEPVIIDGEFCN